MQPKKPPLYDLTYIVVVGFCIAAVTWFLRSGALQLFARHPRPGDDYEFGWFFSILFAIPAGFVIGSLVMFQILMWHSGRSTNQKKGNDNNDP